MHPVNITDSSIKKEFFVDIDNHADEIIMISEYLENSCEIVSFASSCKEIFNVFVNIKENTFFKAIAAEEHLPAFVWKDKEICIQKNGRCVKNGTPLIFETNLFARIFHLKSRNFTCLPAELITMNAFQETINVLNRFFLKGYNCKIEAAVRFDLRSRCGDSLAKLAKEYLDMAPNHPKVKEVEETLKRERNRLIAEKIAVKNRLLELREPGGGGLINTAHQKRFAAHQLYHAACDDRRSKRIYDECITAEREYSDLCLELHRLNQWKFQSKTKERESEVKKLTHCDPTAPLRNRGEFLEELSIDIDPREIYVRHSALNRITYCLCALPDVLRNQY